MGEKGNRSLRPSFDYYLRFPGRSLAVRQSPLP